MTEYEEQELESGLEEEVDMGAGKCTGRAASPQDVTGLEGVIGPDAASPGVMFDETGADGHGHPRGGADMCPGMGTIMGQGA